MEQPTPYDLVVIGSGPAGQKAAIAAAKLRKKVAVIERKRMVGGVCVHTGTIPSKTLREAILYLSGYRQRTFYGKAYTVKEKISVADLAFRVRTIVGRQTQVIQAQLHRNGIDTVAGEARFADPKTVEVDTPEGPVFVRGEHFMVACGTRPAANPEIPLDGVHVFDSDQLLRVPEIPKELIVVGAGVIGIEYAAMLTALDVETTIIDQRPTLLDFADHEVIDALCYHMRRRGATFRLGEKVVRVEKGERGRVVAHLESGKRVQGDALLYTVGRHANADLLRPELAGLVPDSRGRLEVNEHFQTSVPHIYAAGDVIGFPSLASVSMEQGRLASCHMFGAPCRMAPELLPYGIYTIPEISMVGPTEEELTSKKIPYEFGVAKYEELAKGQILGDEVGMLKILFCPDTRKIYAVHAIGDQAAELVHIGQAVIGLGGTMDYLRDMVFNYPTLAEAYKVAALDGLNKLS